MDRAIPRASFHREYDNERSYTPQDLKYLFSFEEAQIDRMGAALLMPRFIVFNVAQKHAKREIWTAETIHYALSVCENDLLALAINLAFSCSLRMGEMLGLTWDCVDLSPESLKAEKASIRIEKELQRASRESMKMLDNKDIMYRQAARGLAA